MFTVGNAAIMCAVKLLSIISYSQSAENCAINFVWGRIVVYKNCTPADIEDR